MVELRPSKPMMRVRFPSAASQPPDGRRASVGTSPSGTRSGGGQGPLRLSSPPSIVTTEPENARPRGEASSATSQAYSVHLPEPLERDGGGGTSPPLGRILAQRLGREAPDGDRRDGHAGGGPRCRTLARERLDGGAGGADVGHRRHTMVGRDGHVDDHPSARGAHRELAPQRASSVPAAMPRLVPPPVISATWPSSTPGANTREGSSATPRSP
jgi:hypothetical protein